MLVTTWQQRGAFWGDTLYFLARDLMALQVNDVIVTFETTTKLRTSENIVKQKTPRFFITNYHPSIHHRSNAKHKNKMIGKQNFQSMEMVLINEAITQYFQQGSIY